MLSFKIPLLLLLAVPATVLACEGECIVSITNAWRGNYTARLDSVFHDLASEISSTLLPSHQDALPLLQPFITSYQNASYNSLENAIFPSYFHGKCQAAPSYTVEPPGCPNPDCPVVCGTPGSLVHFFAKLRFIAWNDTSELLGGLMTPGSGVYEDVETAVVQAAREGQRRSRTKTRPRTFLLGSGYESGLESDTETETDTDTDLGSGLQTRWGRFARALRRANDDNVKAGLKTTLAKFSDMLTQSCGGDASDDEKALPQCSWETEMKQYILSFP